MYGPDGPISDGPGSGRVREIIESGIAKPASPFADERPPSRGPGGSPHAASPESARNGPAFDAARYSGAGDLDPALMGEFTSLARNMSQDQGARLLDLHRKAVGADRARLESAWDSWHATSQRELGHQLPEMVSDIRQAIGEHGDQRDAARFFELLTWSGIEHDPATIRVLHALATGRRRY
jgi:hypothetical protein